VRLDQKAAVAGKGDAAGREHLALRAVDVDFDELWRRQAVRELVERPPLIRRPRTGEPGMELQPAVRREVIERQVRLQLGLLAGVGFHGDNLLDLGPPEQPDAEIALGGAESKPRATAGRQPAEFALKLAFVEAGPHLQFSPRGIEEQPQAAEWARENPVGSAARGQ
jgi:hypothetical protein